MSNSMNLISKSLLIPKCISKIKNWKTPISFYFDEKHNEEIINLRDQTKCSIRNKSDAIAFLENFVLEANTSHKKFQINNEDTIIDIGAHIGCFTIFAGKRAPKGKVLAFEPSDESYVMLKKNIKINNFKNIIVEKNAVSRTKGKQTFYSYKNNEIANTVFKQDGDYTKLEVNTTTLQEICEKYELEEIDFLKMDCEGSEYEIIMNAPTEIINKIKKMSIEIHEKFVPYEKEVIIEYLKKHKFNVEIKESLKGIKMELPLLFAWK